jgi:uncharacterized protein (TIGR02145 family)
MRAKILTVAIAAAMAASAGISHAQQASLAAVFTQQPERERPKLAVYVFGADDPAINKAMATRLIAELANTGRYHTAENYREFFNQAAAEQQKGGAPLISFKQLKSIGQRFRVEYVCVAEIIIVSGVRQVSAYILNTGNGGIVAMGGGNAALKTFADLTVASEQIVRAMFKNAPPPEYASYSPTSVSAASPMLAGMNAPSALAEFTDSRDGKIYKTVNIGGKTWMAQNLNYRTQFGSWCYGNDNSGCNGYGRLYDWNAAERVCPSGWHLPSRQEWDGLVAAAGDTAAGRRLKSASGWSIGGGGLDEYDFSALPGGNRNTAGDFHGAGGNGYWWTGNMNASNSAYYRYMHHNIDSVGEHSENEGIGFSVRCVQDARP